jgi:hypothetical protein
LARIVVSAVAVAVAVLHVAAPRLKIDAATLALLVIAALRVEGSPSTSLSCRSP